MLGTLERLSTTGSSGGKNSGASQPSGAGGTRSCERICVGTSAAE
jgi:hypothetical protein